MTPTLRAILTALNRNHDNRRHPMLAMDTEAAEQAITLLLGAATTAPEIRAIQRVAVRAGFLWACPDCRTANYPTRETCGDCRAPGPADA